MSDLGRIILFGGNAVYALHDTWSFDLATNAWTELHPVGPVPSDRFGNSLGFSDSLRRVFLFGGE